MLVTEDSSHDQLKTVSRARQLSARRCENCQQRPSSTTNYTRHIQTTRRQPESLYNHNNNNNSNNQKSYNYNCNNNNNTNNHSNQKPKKKLPPERETGKKQTLKKESQPRIASRAKKHTIEAQAATVFNGYSRCEQRFTIAQSRSNEKKNSKLLYIN